MTLPSVNHTHFPSARTRSSARVSSWEVAYLYIVNARIVDVTLISHLPFVNLSGSARQKETRTFSHV
jgi:hypothetical protein